MGLTLQKNGMSGEETVLERLQTVLQVSGCDFDSIKTSELLDCWGLNHRSGDRISQLSGGLARRLSVLSGIAPALLSNIPRVIPVLGYCPLRSIAVFLNMIPPNIWITSLPICQGFISVQPSESTIV